MTSKPLLKSFNYTLRVSARARSVRLAVKPFLGLEVVIPKRFPKKQIDFILQQHEDWINRQLHKHRDSFIEPTLPQTIRLPLIDTDFSIQYVPASTAKLAETNNQLFIRHSSEQQAIDQLRLWIRNKARGILTPLLRQLADEFGFNYQKVSIRSQKTRWGSCSSSGTISLNDQLLFMPPATVRYLLIHELCHTRHMNHSKAFWSLVERCCADYRTHDRALSEGRRSIPGWFSHSLHRA
jgi:predicted metal-dependent hydrolase